jgi:mycothiol system anti-sigma-R factor
MSDLNAQAIPCVEVLTSVVFLLEGAPEEMRNPMAIQSHLDTCLACQAEVAHEQAVKSLMQEVLRRSCDEKAPEDLQNSIHEQLLAQMGGGLSSVVTQYSMTEISIEIDEFGNIEHREVQIEQTHISHFKDDDDVS